MTNAEGTTRRERILARLRATGAEPKRSLGQNFLVSDFVVAKIIAAAQSIQFSEMIEVGPGLGALTEDLLLIGAPLTLLELDRKFADYWRGRIDGSPVSLRVQEGDALQMDWSALELPRETLFVSNLPYQISSSLVIERCLEPAGISRMILMFQKEVAQRLAAKSRTKEYGLLTVIAQTFWKIKTVVDAGPQAFYPPPNVSSRVMMFEQIAAPFGPLPNSAASVVEGASGMGDGFVVVADSARAAQADLAGATLPNAAEYLRFVKAAFSHRRKLMHRNLMGEYYQARTDVPPQLELIFQEQGLLVTSRAEELDPKAFVRLYLAARALGAPSKRDL